MPRPARKYMGLKEAKAVLYTLTKIIDNMKDLSYNERLQMNKSLNDLLIYIKSENNKAERKRNANLRKPDGNKT